MNSIGNMEFNFGAGEVKKDRLIVTKRDLENIAFCLEMKFLTIKQLHEKCLNED